jgi:hypothetical protein
MGCITVENVLNIRGMYFTCQSGNILLAEMEKNTYNVNNIRN